MDDIFLHVFEHAAKNNHLSIVSDLYSNELCGGVSGVPYVRLTLCVLHDIVMNWRVSRFSEAADQLLQMYNTIYTVTTVTPLQIAKSSAGLRVINLIWLMSQSVELTSIRERLNTFFPSTGIQLNVKRLYDMSPINKEILRLRQLFGQVTVNEEMMLSFANGRAKQFFGDKFRKAILDRTRRVLSTINTELGLTNIEKVSGDSLDTHAELVTLLNELREHGDRLKPMMYVSPRLKDTDCVNDIVLDSDPDDTETLENLNIPAIGKHLRKVDVIPCVVLVDRLPEGPSHQS